MHTGLPMNGLRCKDDAMKNDAGIHKPEQKITVWSMVSEGIYRIQCSKIFSIYFKRCSNYFNRCSGGFDC